mgnify:CR=1 FL=1
MQENLGTKVDTKEMTLLEEWEESRNKLLDEIANTKDKDTIFKLKSELSNVNHKILLRKLLGRKYCSTNS